MRLTHLLLTCCLLISTTLVVAQDETAVVSTVISTIPSSIIGGGIFHDDSSIKINKEIEIEAKDIIVNIGKVDIEIEREKEKRRSDLELATVEDDHHTTHDDDGNKIKINKEIEIEAKDIIVNIGKVKVEIEKDKRDHHTTKKPTHKPTWKPTHKPTHKPTYLPTWKPPHKPHVSEEGEATDSIEGVDEPSDDATDTIEEADEPSDSSAPSESSGPVTPSEPSEPSEPSTPSAPSEPSEPSSSAEDTSSDDDLLGLDELPLFQDFTPAAEPDLSDETILGENATAAAITVQGGEHEDARGVVILTGPQIFSVTFKIVKEKVITITGTGFDFNTANHATNRTQREAVTFIIRGRGFVPGGNLFNQIDGVVGGTSRGGMFEFLEPRVFLGAIPLKVVRFTDTTILARFLDREDQRRFEPGTLLARVKVLHVDIKKEKKKKHGPGEDIGILGEHDEESTEIVSVGGLVLPALGAIGGSITSGPVLGVIGEDAPGNKHDDHGHDDSISTSLLGLFTGLRFDTAVLAVQFSEKDAQKIRGSVSTLLTDDIII